MTSIDLYNESVIQSINAPIVQSKNKELYECYYCPKCFNVPSLKYDLESKYVLIECTCGTIDDIKIQSPNDDVTKPEVLLDFAEHKKYKLLHDSVIQINSNHAHTHPK